MNQRIFTGIYPCGIVYADRHTEVRGDFKRLAFLPFHGMRLELAADCPPDLAEQIQTSVKKYEGRTKIQTSQCNQWAQLTWDKTGDKS